MLLYGNANILKQIIRIVSHQMKKVNELYGFSSDFFNSQNI